MIAIRVTALLSLHNDSGAAPRADRLAVMGLSEGGLYAAYGSNMDPEQMLERCPHSPAAGTGWLSGWRLTFGGEEMGWDGALAMVVPDAGSQVFVALYDLNPYDQDVLDYWESADTGLYNKIKLRISTLDGDVVAWVYLLD